MNSDLLRQAGEALYGPLWQSQLARALDVADRTMRRWVAGYPIPEKIDKELQALLRDRAKAIAKVVRALS